MSPRIALTSLCLTLLFAAPAALGAEICKGGPKSQWLKPAAVKEKLAAMGYTNFTLHVEDGCYEAKLIDQNKRRVEIYVDPVSGDVVKKVVQ